MSPSLNPNLNQPNLNSTYLKSNNYLSNTRIKYENKIDDTDDVGHDLRLLLHLLIWLISDCVSSQIHFCPDLDKHLMFHLRDVSILIFCWGVSAC